MIKLSLQNTWAHKRRLVGTFLAVLIGVSFLLPTILFYTAFVYWTFRGKVRIDSGYH